MKLLVLGANGRTGQEVVKQALEKGHEVIAYVRREGTLEKQNNLNIIIGEIHEVNKLSEAMEGIDAVIITLGNSIKNRNNSLFEIVIPPIIKAANQAKITRIISLSALGVGDTYKNTMYPYRLGVKTFLKGNFEDHYKGESILMNSKVNWSTIHPGPLFDGTKTENPLIAYGNSNIKMPRSPRTHRADVANLILNIINDNKTYKQKVLISSNNKSK
ncbi:NAD(P)-dependent oxidoreductase [Staphylococcus saprophyticus]|uniref:NAD(P)-dependent oxidoreductase n=1 Tax=Staphylococcus saprophyticus TaxID=29385 RepID=UPI0008532AC0|nr:NAD(P)-binding oxidoreductase [Staphylococcus saprophyticus]OEK99529.1 NADH-flavin reductase [Staphylococcus saprophyticus]